LAYKNLPYNKDLTERAKNLRKGGNLPEVVFWNRVKRKRFKHLDFDRQKVIGNYIVDFYCANCKLVVEIDGSSHYNKKKYDMKRDVYLRSLGLVVVHFKVNDVMHNLGKVLVSLGSIIDTQCVVVVPRARTSGLYRQQRRENTNAERLTTPSSPLAKPPLRRRGSTPGITARKEPPRYA
jgi:very-short-patch-repair endonuclease